VVFAPSGKEEMLINSSTGAVTYINAERRKPVQLVQMDGGIGTDAKIEERLKLAKEVIMMSSNNNQRPKTSKNI
jgi:hypothetical protein